MRLFHSEDLIFLLQSIRCEDHMSFMFMSQKPSAHCSYGMTASLQHVPRVSTEKSCFPAGRVTWHWD